MNICNETLEIVETVWLRVSSVSTISRQKFTVTNLTMFTMFCQLVKLVNLVMSFFVIPISEIAISEQIPLTYCREKD